MVHVRFDVGVGAPRHSEMRAEQLGRERHDRQRVGQRADRVVEAHQELVASLGLPPFGDVDECANRAAWLVMVVEQWNGVFEQSHDAAIVVNHIEFEVPHLSPFAGSDLHGQVLRIDVVSSSVADAKPQRPFVKGCGQRCVGRRR